MPQDDVLVVLRDVNRLQAFEIILSKLVCMYVIVAFFVRGYMVIFSLFGLPLIYTLHIGLN